MKVCLRWDFISIAVSVWVELVSRTHHSPLGVPSTTGHGVRIQAKLLESALSMTMNISLARFAKTPMASVCAAVLSFDVETLGGFDVIKMLLDMQCYDPGVTKPLAGD